MIAQASSEPRGDQRRRRPLVGHREAPGKQIHEPLVLLAQVDTVERDTGQMFARITCSPLSGVDRSQFLLVLGQAAALPQRPEEPGDADATKKGGRGKGRRGG